MKTSHQLGLGVGFLAVTTGVFALLAALQVRSLRTEADQLRLSGFASDVANSKLIDGATKLEYTLGALFDARLANPQHQVNWPRLDEALTRLQTATTAASNIVAKRAQLSQDPVAQDETPLLSEEQKQLAQIKHLLEAISAQTHPSDTSLAAHDQALNQASDLTRSQLIPAIERYRVIIQQLQAGQISALSETAESLLQLSLLAGLLTLAIAALLVVVMYRQLVTPLLRFEQVARAISAGQTQLRLGIRYRQYNEFGTLAAAFDDMLDTLEATTISQQELETRANQRSRELHESEERLRDLFNNTTDLIQSIDLDGRFLYVNRAWREALGYAEADMPGLTIMDVVAPSHREHCATAFRRLLAGESLGTFAVNFITKSGRTLPVEGQVSARLEPGRPVITRGIFRDISHRQQHEEATRRHLEFLESLNQTTLDLFGHRQLSDLLPTIVERTARLLDATCAELVLFEGDTFVVRGVYGPVHGPACVRSQQAQTALFKRAMTSREPVLFDKPTDLADDHPIAVFPILRGPDCLGIISLRQAAGHAFSTADRQKGQVIAQLTALALHNTTIYEEALRAAEAKTAALLESENIYRHLVENINQGFYTANGRGLFTYCNPAISVVAGKEVSALLGTSSFRLVAEEDRARVIAQYREWAQSPVTDVSTEFRTIKPDGQKVWIEQITHILRKPDGTVQEFRNFLRDITERKAAQVALTQVEQKFRDLFAFAPDAMLIANIDGHITDVNQRALTLFGFSREELVGQTAALLIPPAHRPVLLRRLHTYLANPVPHAMGESAPGLIAWDKTGRSFPIDISLNPLNTSQGSFVVTAIRDITKQQAAEQARYQTEVQLRQTQKIESIGTLAGGIAHDFNNILTGMLGAVEIAAQEIPPEHPAAYWLGHISAAGSRAKNLVQQILTFSRKNEGQLIAQPLQPVITEALSLLRSTIPSMIRIETQVDATCPPVLADSTQIHQIVMNLCTNAWHAVSEENGLIHVSLSPVRLTPALAQLHPHLPPGHYVRLAICDNGPGITPDVREHLFEPFFTTKPQGQGTGLGLAVVHGIVQGHKGDIIVHSEPGQGTMFEVLLPSVLSDQPTTATPIKPAPIPSRHDRVLLIDDDKLALVALEGMLRQLGCQVTAFNDPAAALQHFLRQPSQFDLVISDLAMPGLAGPQLATKLLAAHPSLPIILVSGYVDPRKLAELRSLGIREILRKPFTLPELSATIQHHLDPASDA